MEFVGTGTSTEYLVLAAVHGLDHVKDAQGKTMYDVFATGGSIWNVVLDFPGEVLSNSGIIESRLGKSLVVMLVKSSSPCYRRDKSCQLSHVCCKKALTIFA